MPAGADSNNPVLSSLPSDEGTEVVLPGLGPGRPSHSRRATRRLSADEGPEPPEQSDIKSMISMDPPEHSRYRGTILPGLKRRQGAGPCKRASAIRDGARKILEDFAAAARSAGPDGVDFVKHVAVELPVQMLAELFQVPASRHDDLFRWSNAIVSRRAARRCAPRTRAFGDGRSAGRR